MAPGYKGSNGEKKKKKKESLIICQYQEEAERRDQNWGEMLYFSIADMK